MHTVTIVGVGLIGGSFGLALRAAGFTGRILGVSSEATLRAALDCGAIDAGASLEEAVPQSDLIYLSHAIGRILDTLPRVARLARPDALVTDAGSTKTEIVARASEAFPPGGALFLGGHPMAGKAARGVQEAEAGLFENAAYVLTPREGVLPDDPRVRSFHRVVENMGAKVLILTPEIHDQIVAFTSHLPQIASTALACVLLQQIRDTRYRQVAGGGLRDMTRLAQSAFELWRDICKTNAGNIEGALDAYIQELEHLRENLRQPALRDGFERGAKFVEHFQTMFENPT